jgi:hypothetical protein
MGLVSGGEGIEIPTIETIIELRVKGSWRRVSSDR